MRFTKIYTVQHVTNYTHAYAIGIIDTQSVFIYIPSVEFYIITPDKARTKFYYSEHSHPMLINELEAIEENISSYGPFLKKMLIDYTEKFDINITK